jgi:hypothetical protein
MSEAIAETPTPAQPVYSHFHKGWGITTFVALIITLGCGWAIARRVQAYNASADRVIFAFDSRNETEFTFAGRPVKITTDRTDRSSEFLDVTYGDEKLRLRVAVPGNALLPGLIPHSDWMRLLRFARMSGRTPEQYKADLGSEQLPERLAIVTRVPRPGSDPNTWGQVWIKDWTFEFYEFNPAGGFVAQKYKYPSHRRGQQPKAGELKDNTWEFQAAMQLMPQQARERLMGKFPDAMSGLGIFLPGAGLFGALSVFAAAFAFAPRRLPS